MATMRDQEMRRRGWSSTRWLVVAGVVIAIAVAVVLIVIYTGGSGGKGY